LKDSYFVFFVWKNGKNSRENALRRTTKTFHNEKLYRILAKANTLRNFISNTSMVTTLHSEAYLNELDRELAVTRTLLERLPEDRLDFAPHPKSMTLVKLASHLVNLVNLNIQILQNDYRDVLSRPPMPPTPTSIAEILSRFDVNSENLRKVLKETDDEKFERAYQMQAGEKVLMDRPKGAALRIMGFNHAVHHRGQLSVYLRLLDVPVPGMYGPSADEQGTF